MSSGMTSQFVLAGVSMKFSQEFPELPHTFAHVNPSLNGTRKNEFGSMTARNDESSLIKLLFAIKDHTIRYHARPYKPIQE